MSYNKVQINVAKEIAPRPSSRDLIRNLLEEKCKGADLIVLDFSGVQFVSRSFAHELLMYIKKNPDKKLLLLRMNEDVKKMVELVRRQI